MQIYGRDLAKEIGDLLRHFPAVVLTGPRQCGKTTLARGFHEVIADLAPDHTYVIAPVDERYPLGKEITCQTPHDGSTGAG